ncbi:MAG: hypothetical protein M1150_03625 [Patescibacteria group bacterium]|nr:hypothetical protein [Patescibacteria group bacterium]
MDIKDFVKVTLKELSEALSESKKELNKKVSLTNVPLRTKGSGNYGLIDFDLAVEAKTAEISGKSAGVKISVVEASLGKDKELTSSSISRVRFTVEADF